jgi:hypothetical protein
VLTAVFILAAGVAVIGLVAVRRSRITVPVTRIADAPDATLVRIHGRVTDGATLRAPYTGRPCVYYRIDFAFVQFNRRERYTHSESNDFTVSDDTGIARVIRDGVQFEVNRDEGEATRASNLSERALGVIRELRWPVPEIAAVELAESVIAVGDEVDIAGTPSREASAADQGERGFRDAPGTQLVFSGKTYVLKR